MVHTNRWRKSYIILAFLIVGILIYFLKNIHYYYIPVPDVFEFLTEGKTFFNNPLTWIATPPAYSVLLYILEKILPFNNPGIVGGVLFNIFCFILSVIVIWKLFENWLGKSVYVVLFLFIIHPLSALTNLQPLNTSPALLLILLVFYFYPRRPILAHILIMLAFLCRYESVVLFPVIIVWDLAKHKRLIHPLALALSSVPVVIWTIGGLIEDTVYKPEYTTLGSHIPNTDFLINTFSSAVSTCVPGSIVLTLIVILWLTVGILICYKRGIIGPMLSGVFIAGYCIVHMLFPASDPRYGYIILPFILALLYWPCACLYQLTPMQKTVITALFFVLTLEMTYTSLRYRSIQTNLRWDRADKRVAGTWLKNNISKPSIVYAFMNDIINYYAKNTLIDYPQRYSNSSLTKNICENKKDVLVFIGNDVIKKRYYYDFANGQDFADLFMQSEVFPYFQHRTTLAIQNYALKVFQYRAGSVTHNSQLETICLKSE